MSIASNAGLVGALIGLGFGAAKYAMAMAIIGATVGREAKRAPENVDFTGISSKVRSVRRALLLGSFGALPLAGYAAGRLLGH